MMIIVDCGKVNQLSNQLCDAMTREMQGWACGVKQELGRYTNTFRNSEKYIWQFAQIYLAIEQMNLSIWTNILCNVMTKEMEECVCVWGEVGTMEIYMKQDKIYMEKKIILTSNMEYEKKENKSPAKYIYNDI